ncbi:TPA_asm: deaminated glutathione amidase [Salmonella enterica subsp. enterica serovar Typhimurium]|nr:deaminated glutathione amidase [Salmonella enterica subsp. enterica serovar Typhimurium]
MFVAAGQFVVSSVWEENAQVCVSLMAQAAGRGVSLLVLPEGILARDDIDLDLPIRAAQPLDGAFMTRLLEESAHNNMTTIFTILVPSTPGRAVNMLVALRAGHIVARYAKLHLYDAFSMQESQSIDAGTVIAPVLDVEGVKVGLMTCYDLRFPDMALALALQGADVLALPTGWVRGPLKEQQWSTLLAARALDTTSYMIAAGECGNRNIGQSRIIDPLGVTIAAAADRPALIVAEIFRERIDQVREQLPLLQQRRFAPPQLLRCFFTQSLIHLVTDCYCVRASKDR